MKNVTKKAIILLDLFTMLEIFDGCLLSF